MTSKVSPENTTHGINTRSSIIVTNPRLKELKFHSQSQSTNEQSILIPEPYEDSPMSRRGSTDGSADENTVINPKVRRIASVDTVITPTRKKVKIDPNAAAVSSGGSTGRKKPMSTRWKKVKSAAEVVGCLNEYKKDILLFGSSKVDIPREPPPPPPKPKYIIPHDNIFKVWWDRFLVIVYIYLVTLMPISICFFQEEPKDIVLTFFTSYLDLNNQPVYEWKKIVIHYLTGWFVIDLISTIPWNLFFTNSNDRRYTKLVRLSKLLRIIRLIRIFKINHIFKRKSNFGISDLILMNRNAGLFRLLKFYMYTIICIHIASCIWFLLAQASSFTPDTWIYRRYCTNLINPCESPTSESEAILPGFYVCTKDELLNAENMCLDYAFSHKTTMYIDGLYFALSTILTVGYGDITAFTDIEKILVIFLMFIGGTLYSIQISSLTSFISTLDDKENVYQRNLDRINTFCNETNLSSEYRKKMKRDYTYLFKAGTASVSIAERDVLLQLISPNLRVEILTYICKGVVDRIPFFKKKDTMFVAKAVDLLKPVEYKDGEYVMRESQYTCGMFFVIKGSVVLLADDNSKELRIIAEGGFFGESAAFCPFNRYSARAKGQCELFVLSRKAMKEVLSEFPHMAQELRDIAEKREQKLFQGLVTKGYYNYPHPPLSTSVLPSANSNNNNNNGAFDSPSFTRSTSLLKMPEPSPSQKFRNLTPLKKLFIKSKSKEKMDNDSCKEQNESSPIPPPQTPPPLVNEKHIPLIRSNLVKSLPKLETLSNNDSSKSTNKLDVNMIQNVINSLQELLKSQNFVESGSTPPQTSL